MPPYRVVGSLIQLIHVKTAQWQEHLILMNVNY